MPISTNRTVRSGFAEPVMASTAGPATRRCSACCCHASSALAATSARPGDAARSGAGSADLRHSRIRRTARTPPRRPTAPSDAEVAALRAETTGQLQTINPRPRRRCDRPPRPPPAPRAIVGDRRDHVADRIGRRQATPRTPSGTAPAAGRVRKSVEHRLRRPTHPEPSPEQQATEAKAELARLQALLAQAATNPESCCRRHSGRRRPGASHRSARR